MKTKLGLPLPPHLYYVTAIPSKTTTPLLISMWYLIYWC